MFTIQNAVMLALMQMGTIVAGVLAAGLTYRFIGEEYVPLTILWIVNYGVMALLVPIIWVASVLTVRQRAEISDDAKNLAFLSGVVLLVALVLYAAYLVISPWGHITWDVGGGED